ncbi:MAG: PKD domain-containing protein [Bacteroidetes bacterium]|nr:PKD domain-containing protein [Bacteroidota bacterium]
MKFQFFFILFVLNFSARASHIIGGDIYYDYIGNNQYRFFITLYRDCLSTGAEYDNPLKLTVYNASGNLVEDLSVPFPGSVTLPLIFTNPCATPPNNICVERAIYTIVVNLPPIPGGYTISYQRCCRGPNISNLVDPDDTGLTLTTKVPGSETGFAQNSSPRFTNYPPILLCNNDELIFNHSATDPDGDVLQYSLVTPFNGASSVDPAPNQAPPPPYFPVQWIGPFNAQAPLGPGSSTVIDQNTGILTVNPSIIGLFVVGVMVQEYRNGVLIGQTVRDFLFKVFDCNITLQAILPAQEELGTFVSFCQGLTVQFENNSFGGSSYAWDFGVGATNSDVSNAFEPVFTYPAPGTYSAQLIVNPGQACTDTTFMQITVNNPFSLSWSSQDSLCILENSFDFIGQTSNSSAIFSWDFPQESSVPTSSNLVVNDVTFSTPGFHTITINGSDGDCIINFTDSIFILAMPVSSFNAPPLVQCIGLTIPLENNSTNASSFQWDFGISNSNSDQSSEFEPIVFYQNPGTYNVQLIASSSGLCIDTSTITITVNEPLVMSFTHTDSLCITNGLYDFDATVSGPPSTLYEWNFGSSASPSSAQTIDVSDVQFLTPGNHPISLIGSYDVCSDTVYSNVFVYANPEINFLFLNSLLCAPASAQFINLSISDTQPTYFWDFGDGSSSTQFSPSHVYSNAGNYSVGLTMITSIGCIDTLYLFQQDLINVYPSPIAGFSVNPNKVDVCNSEVRFIDQSIGGNQYFYFFENNSLSSQEPNFVYEYMNPGTDYPLQVVFNQYGCSDSARATVFVEPFSLYIPNAFIPDDNGLNDEFQPVTGFEIIEWNFKIYNRWGQKVFETDEFGTAWNGVFEGKNCEDGLYAYLLTYRSCANPINEEKIAGHVSLIR